MQPAPQYLIFRNLISHRPSNEHLRWEFSMSRFLVPLCLLLSSLAVAQSGTVGLNAPQLYQRGMNSLLGVGLSRNGLNAVDYFRRSADLGYPQAQVALGYFYDSGSIVPRDSQQAADWYKKAARQDDRLADWLLGRLYYTGDGVPRDLNTADSWLLKAANQGDPFWTISAGPDPPRAQ
jgi:hypothetical protein